MSEQNPGYEKKDINIKQSLLVGLAIILFIVVSLVVVNELFIYEKEQVVYEQQLQPESVSLQEVRAREDSVLTSYELIDTTKNRYRIPLQRALELTAAEADGDK